MVAPVAAAALSNADVALLAMGGPRSGAGGLGVVLTTTVPLSLAASGLTLWFLLRLRREVDRSAEAERTVRTALADLGCALDRERMLRRELDHRVRNNLSALLGLVGIYEAGGATPGDMVQSLRGKILTLRESYNLIAATHGEGIELADLLRAVVAAVVDDGAGRTVSLDGPSVRLTSREANAFAMIVQELLANSAKHGALRHAGGTIAVTWETAPAPPRGASTARVNLRWLEQPIADAPGAPPDEHSGLGLALVQALAASDLRGSMSFARSSDRWTVDLVANLKTPGAAAEARTNTEVCA